MESKGLVDGALQYGAIGIAAIVFALAAVILWRHMTAREDKWSAEREAMIKERAAWDVTEAKIRKECEERIAALIQANQQQMRNDHAALLQREDDVRKDFAEMMEKITIKQGEASTAVTAVLEKFYDRFVGPRPRY